LINGKILWAIGLACGVNWLAHHWSNFRRTSSVISGVNGKWFWSGLRHICESVIYKREEKQKIKIKIYNHS
jgi:hypothetical protein